MNIGYFVLLVTLETSQRIVYLIFDGTTLEQRRGIFAVMEARSFSVLYGAPDMSEGPSDLLPFCVSLAQRGLSPRNTNAYANNFSPALYKFLALGHVSIYIISFVRGKPIKRSSNLIDLD